MDGDACGDPVIIVAIHRLENPIIVEHIERNRIERHLVGIHQFNLHIEFLAHLDLLSSGNQPDGGIVRLLFLPCKKIVHRRKNPNLRPDFGIS